MPVSHLVLPAGILSYSMVIFAVWPLLKNLRFHCLILVAYGLGSVFLVNNSIYLGFLAQVATIPVVLGAVIFIFYTTREDFEEWGGNVLLLYLVANIAVYNICALLPVLLAIAIRIAWGLRGIPVTLLLIWNGFSRFYQSLSWLLILSLGFMLLPILRSLAFYLNIIPGPNREDFLSAVGIMGTLLSPLLLTGVWIPGVDFRHSVGSGFGEWAILSVFAAQIIIFVKTGSPKLKLALMAMLIPLAITAFVTKSVYVNFKYLSFIAPLISAAFLALMLEKRVNLIKIVSSAAFVLFCSFGLLSSLASFKSLTNKDFEVFNLIKVEALEKGETLILSKEDWLSLPLQRGDDAAPLTQYLHRRLVKKRFDYIVYDRRYAIEADALLATKPNLRGRFRRSKCRKLIAGRFELVKLRC